MLLSIITLNYTKSYLTLRCVASVHEQFAKELKSNEMEVIIVDNKSPDDSVQKIKGDIKKNKYHNITLYPNSSNAGFGAGNNYGVKQARGKYIVLLNNDTVVKDAGILEMAKYLEEHPDIAILGGQLRNFDGSLQASAGTFYTPFNALLLLLGFQRFDLLDKSPREVTQVDWVKGGLFMIRKDVFDKLGGFDEHIFMYTEDMELCYRAHLSGYKIYFFPDVNVLHADQGSSSRTFAVVNIYKNLLYFYKKHRSRSDYLFLRLLMQSKAKMLIFIGKLTHNTYLSQTYEQALAAL